MLINIYLFSVRKDPYLPTSTSFFSTILYVYNPEIGRKNHFYDREKLFCVISYFCREELVIDTSDYIIFHCDYQRMYLDGRTEHK